LIALRQLDIGQAFFFVGFFVLVLGIGVKVNFALHAWLGIGMVKERQNI